MTDYLTYSIVVLGLLMAPGPTNVLVASAAASLGWRRAATLLPLVIGAYLAAVLGWALLAGPLLSYLPGLPTALRLACACWLLWLAVGLWRGGGEAGRTSFAGPGRLFVTTVLNPKGFVLAFAIVPNLTPPEPAAVPYLAALAPLLATSTALWVAVGTVIGANFRAKPIERTTAVFIAALAIVMASPAVT